jgi:hypothetical protein
MVYITNANDGIDASSSPNLKLRQLYIEKPLQQAKLAANLCGNICENVCCGKLIFEVSTTYYEN